MIETDNNDLAKEAAAGHPLPHSPTDLFWLFSGVALQGFGGVQAVVQRELVERKRWMTREEFLGNWAMAQVLPGPNMVTMALMFGDQSFGLRGALAAMAGMLAFPLLLVLLLALAYTSLQSVPEVQGALRGMGGPIIALILVNGFKLLSALRHNVMGVAACALVALAMFTAVAVLRVPLLWALLLVGGAAGAWAYRQLGRTRVLKGGA